MSPRLATPLPLLVPLLRVVRRRRDAALLPVAVAVVTSLVVPPRPADLMRGVVVVRLPAPLAAVVAWPFFTRAATVLLDGPPLE